ncbi:MAG: cell division protein FtsL [Thalassolituus sp.]
MSIGQVVLWAAVLLTALAQINAVTWHRDLLKEWQKADAGRQQLTQEYSRLVLEKSTLMAHGRIDTLARKRLQMKEPEHTRIFR